MSTFMKCIASVVLCVLAATAMPEVLPGMAPGAIPSTPVASPGSDQTLAIIVNQTNTVDNFSLAELRKIFLGERSHWPNGRRITLVMMDPAQPERKVILREIYGMNERDLNQHFIQGVFTGVVQVSPKTLATPADVLK